MRDQSPSERLLLGLGVTTPEEIDLDAIAYHLGIRVRYRPLVGCVARILANGDRGIVSVDSRCRYERQRFSIAHELGHWQHHRGQGVICTAQDIFEDNRQAAEREKLANRFASQLILPSYLVRPFVRKASRITWKLVDQVATEFQASRLATAIRLVDLNVVPVVLVCHRKAGRAWFSRARDVPTRWFPQEQLSADSSAIDCLFGEQISTRRIEMPASAWFDRSEADRYEIEEESVVGYEGEVLSLLNITDELMLEDV